MNAPNKKYWFPAKRYGWGWGPPSAWQGWVVVGLFAVATALVIILVPPQREPVRFLVGVMACTFGMLGVCWLKGEPPRWRWGEGDKDQDGRDR